MQPRLRAVRRVPPVQSGQQGRQTEGVDAMPADPAGVAAGAADAVLAASSSVASVAGSSVSASLSRERILDATAECLGREGYDRTTIRAIAAALDCAVGSIYRYFADKRELLSVVTQRRFVAVQQAVADRQPVDRTVRAYHAAASSDRSQYALMFWLTTLPTGKENTSAVRGSGGPGHPGMRPGAGGTGALPEVVRMIVSGWSAQLGDPAGAKRMWALLHASALQNLPPDDALALAETPRTSGHTRTPAEEPSALSDRQALPAVSLVSIAHNHDDPTLL